MATLDFKLEIGETITKEKTDKIMQWVEKYTKEVRKQALADMLDVIARACKTQDFISIDKFLKMEGL